MEGLYAMSLKEELASHAAAQKATAGSYTASSGAFVIGGLTANEVAAYGGLLLAFLTFCVNSFFRYREYQLNKARNDPSNPKS